MDFQASKLGIAATSYTGGTGTHDTRLWLTRARAAFDGLDVLGLLFFAAAWALLLIPLTLVNNATSTWHSPRIIAMITLGCVGLIGFGVYEVHWAKVPIIPARFLRNN
jgi:hypothetical protein